MLTLIESISLLSNYKFYNTEKYILVFISGTDKGTLIDYIYINNIDNVSDDILGNIINRNINIKPCSLINFFRYSSITNKLTLLFTTFIKENKCSDKIVLSGIQKHIILNSPLKIQDFVMEMFITNLLPTNSNKMIINTNNDDSKLLFNQFLIKPNYLKHPVFNRVINIFYDEVLSYTYKSSNSIGLDDNLHINTFVSPITGSLQFFNNNDKTWLNNGSKRINIPTLVKLNIEDFVKGSSFIGTSKINHMYIPFDGFLNRIIKYDNMTVFRVSNEYFISDLDDSKFKWNYSQDNALKINRENPLITTKQENYVLEYHIVVFGKIEFGNNILKSIYSTLKANETYKIRPIFLQKGKHLCKILSGKTVYVCLNRKIKDLHDNAGIRSFFEIGNNIGEII